MKRYCTLIGGIIAIAYDAIYIILIIFDIALILELFNEVQGGKLVALLSLIDVILATVTLVFNSIAITAYSCSHEKYLTKKRPIVITAIVLNSVLVVLSIMSFSVYVAVNIVILFLISLMAAIMFIIDIALEDKRYLNEVVVALEEDEENK